MKISKSNILKPQKNTSEKIELSEAQLRQVQKIKRLYEYNVVEGKKVEPLYHQLDEADPTGTVDPNQTAPVDTTTPAAETPIDSQIPQATPADPTAISNDIPVDPTVPDEPQDTNDSIVDNKIDLLKGVVEIHKDKLDMLMTYIEGLDQEIMELQNKTIGIDVLSDKTEQMQKQIDFLTPPTAEESLQKMIDISGGYSIDDYWKSYYEKQGKNVQGKIPYYQNGVTTTNPAEVKLPNYSDDDIKASLGLK